MKVMLRINICFVLTLASAFIIHLIANVVEYSLFWTIFFIVFSSSVFFFIQRQKYSSWMNSSNHWSTSIMKSIRRSNWCALYGMCRCFHPPYIGYTETICWILTWHAVALGKLFHKISFLKSFQFFKVTTLPLFFSLSLNSYFLYHVRFWCLIYHINFGKKKSRKNQKSHIKRYCNKISANSSMQTGSKFVLLRQKFCWCQTKYYIYKKIPNGIRLKW